MLPDEPAGRAPTANFSPAYRKFTAAQPTASLTARLRIQAKYIDVAFLELCHKLATFEAKCKYSLASRRGQLGGLFYGWHYQRTSNTETKRRRRWFKLRRSQSCSI